MASRLLTAVSAVVLVPALVLATVGTAEAASSPPTNPRAPFLVDRPLASGAWGAPALASDGTGVLAAYVGAQPDGRHLYVARWTPGGGWGRATQLFVGGIEPSGVHVSVVAGRAAVWWFDDIGRSVRRMSVSVRDGVGAPWTPAHQVYRSNTSTFGGLAVGSSGVTALFGLRVFGPPDHTVMTAQSWDPTHGWGADQVLSDTGGYIFDVAAVGDRVVAFWQNGLTNLRYSTFTSGVWAPAQDLTAPGLPCTFANEGGSPARFFVLTACSGASPSYAALEWPAGGSAAPVSTPVTVPAGAAPTSVDVSGSQAALLTTSEGSGGTVSLVRSSAPGTWSAPVVVTTKAYVGATVSLGGAYALVTWGEFANHRSRIVSRATQFADGTFLAPPVAVTPWSSVFFNVQASTSNGSVAAWQFTAGRAHYVQAATWTARGGWSKPRVLTLQYAYSLVPSVAVAGSNAMVGWASPSADGATAASLRDPQPTGPARVTKSGRTLTCTAPRFSPAPAMISYRWLVNGKAVYGATSRTLRVSGSLLGKPLVCRVTASTQGFSPKTAYATAVVVH